ncbi:MAG: PIG-L family deacetylase [Ekhidna sp.]
MGGETVTKANENQTMKKSFVLSAMLLVLTLPFLLAQGPRQFRPGEIRKKLEKLNVLGTVLYVAAHPDDENTRMIAYYANEKLMRTGYLAATRGDGGQNLIGPEIRESLGVIRTQELLAARRVDGGQQFFSRANDFGYSKTPDETFKIWDKDAVLADFVWVFRNFRPDVIITRFNSEGRNHGHHTASAILAKEAFELSGDEQAYPEQLSYVTPWQPKKIFWNTGWWWFRNNDQDSTQLQTIDVGSYNALLGESYGEIAARSRSMHKSQGFGSSGSRGEQIEYLEQWVGEETENPLDGIDTSWGRVEGGEEVAFLIQKAINEYDESQPWNVLESLVLARKALNKVEDDFWREVKREELNELIISITGLYIAFTANDASYTPGDSIKISIEVINRSDAPIKLSEIQFNHQVNPIPYETDLINNKRFVSEVNFQLPKSIKYSNPYWLEEPSKLGMYTVSDQQMRGKPENDPPVYGLVSLNVGGENIDLRVPVMFRRTDPVDGEVVEPLTIGPPVAVNVEGTVLVFGDDQPKAVEVRVIAGKANASGEVSLAVPGGWKSEPSTASFDLKRKNEEQVFTFMVTPPRKSSEGVITGTAKINGETYTRAKEVIDYDHIPTQTLYPSSSIKVVKVNVDRRGNRIGYIEGAGDAIPENLKQIGYEVVTLGKDDVTAKNLATFDAVILGVRAFNTVDWLEFKNEELFEYVKQGGNVIVQYNTSHRLVTQKVAPYDLKLSRERVTDEGAEMRMLDTKHPVLSSPNKITSDDFEGWVQERGLYFPNEWSEEFSPVISSNDAGESAKEGGLLVAKYGEGYYVYTGYSWFRQLPAGVPGAYRIFVNMISLGK